MVKKHVIILFAGRFPSEKAAALFVDLNAKSLVEAGAYVTVLAPRRLGRDALTNVPYDVRYLPTIDLSRIPVLWTVANFVAVWVFAKWACMWIFLFTKKEVIVISNDAWPLLVATVLRRNTIYEMHDFAKQNWMYQTLVSRVRFVLVTNEWKRREVMRQFGLPEGKVILERNAVDTESFGVMDKKTARTQLNLGLEQRLVVYTGHLYEWKGAATLAAAAVLLPDIQFVFVGGVAADVAAFTSKHASIKNIRIMGHVPHEEIPTWQSAADVLVLPNSAKEEISAHYTSPMKLFEYMASERPIVASDLPSVREVLDDTTAYFATPDDPATFVTAISDALNDTAKAVSSRLMSKNYSWDTRAKRILSRIV